MKYTLNQKKAINTIDKNLQIIACAGSGKTQVVSQRIANILKSKSDISPKNTIAFTYTEKAAGELKTRILNRNLPFNYGVPNHHLIIAMTERGLTMGSHIHLMVREVKLKLKA